MTDWQEAGRKADAHRVRDLYRKVFDQDPKTVARRRAIEVLQAAGGETCLDLWGGGISAEAMVAAALHVISVEDGSLDLEDRGHVVRSARKRRALEMTADEGGYAARWGKVPAFAAEADVAFLDFCGPWSGDVRRAVESCRHMKAVVVTLMTDHDINSGATTQLERMEAYKTFLRIAFAGPKVQDQRRTPCRLLCRYRRITGQPVWMFLLARNRLPIRHLSHAERRIFHPGERTTWATRVRTPEQRARAVQRTREWVERQKAADPVGYSERKSAYDRAYRARRRESAASD